MLKMRKVTGSRSNYFFLKVVQVHVFIQDAYYRDSSTYIVYVLQLLYSGRIAPLWNYCNFYLRSYNGTLQLQKFVIVRVI